MPDLTRVHLFLWKSFSMFCIVQKQLTLQFKRSSGYRWHKNIFTFRYLTDCWITIDCNEFNHVLFILRLLPNRETIFNCYLRKRDGSWIFVVPNLGVSDFENRINFSVEYESKSSAQLGQETNPVLEIGKRQEKWDETYFGIIGYVSMYQCIYVCLSVYMYPCMYVYMYICMYVYICIYMYVYIYIYVMCHIYTSITT